MPYNKPYILFLIIFVFTANISYAATGKVGTIAELNSDDIKLVSDIPIRNLHVIYNIEEEHKDSDVMSFIQALEIEIYQKGFGFSEVPERAELVLSLEIKKIYKDYWSGLPTEFGRQRRIDCISVNTTYKTSRGQWNKEFIAHKGYWTFKGDSYFRDTTSDDLSRAIINPLHDYPKEKSFIAAAGSGNIKAVYKLLGENVNIDADNDSRDTALIAASEGGHSEIMQLLLSRNAYIDARNEKGWSSLTHTAYNGDLEATMMLLDSGAYVNTEDNDKRTPLDWAVLQGKRQIVMLLLSHGAEVGNALGLAGKKGDKELEEMLSAHDEERSPSADYDCRHLSGLIKNENKEKIEFLIKNNLMIVAPETDPCRDALITAAKKGNKKIIKSFLDQGFDVNGANASGELPIIEAAARGHKETVDMLISNGADLNSFGSSALTSAAMNGQSDVVKFLLSEMVDVDSRGKSGQTLGKTPLGEAARAGNKEMIELLLSEGADINAKNNIGRTALMAAALDGRTKTVALLLSRGANVNQEDKDGQTALGLVAKARMRFSTIDYRDVVTLLKMEEHRSSDRRRTLKSNKKAIF